MRFPSGKPDLTELKTHTSAYYRRLKPIYCPILGETVRFTAEGYFHLINESNSTPYRTYPRDPAEQYMKLMYLRDVPAVLKYSGLISEHRRNRKKVKGKWKNIVQTEIVHTIKGVKISVIVEKSGDGDAKFVSVFPTSRTIK